MKDQFTLSKIQKIRSFKKNNLGYFGKDISEVSKDIKDKGLYTILSAAMALPFAACGTDNPVTPTNRVTLNVSKYFTDSAVDGKIVTDKQEYPVTSIGPIEVEWKTDPDIRYTGSNVNADVVVSGLDNGRYPVTLVNREKAEAEYHNTGGTIARAEGITPIYVPEDTIKTDGVDDRQAVLETLAETPFNTMYTVSTNPNEPFHYVLNQPLNSSTSVPSTGKITSGAIYLRDKVDKGAIRRESVEFKIAHDNGELIPGYTGLLNGGYDNWTGDDTVLYGLNFTDWKITATIDSAGTIYNK